MGKRPSLAETMRQVAVPPPAATPVRAAPTIVPEPPPAEPEVAPVTRPYFAATRAGKKKVTLALSPAAHKQLKGLAVDRETKTETLMAEALRDLFGKYGKPAID